MLNHAVPDFDPKPHTGYAARLQNFLAISEKCYGNLPQNEQHIFLELLSKFKLKGEAECYSHQLLETFTDFSGIFEVILQKDLGLKATSKEVIGIIAILCKCK